MITETTQYNAVIHAFYSELTEDVQMQMLMVDPPADRGEWLYDTDAEPDAAFPYLVHSIALADSGGEDNWSCQNGLYTIDIWTLGLKTVLRQKIRQRIITLVDQGRFVIDDYPHRTWMRVWKIAGEDSIPTDDELVKRYTLPFAVRYGRKREISLIETR